MTNSRSAAEPHTDTPSEAPSPSEAPPAKPRRIGHRRASAPAGAPQQAAKSALLVVGSDGMIASSPAADDAGSLAEEAAPAAVEADADSPAGSAGSAGSAAMPDAVADVADVADDSPEADEVPAGATSDAADADSSAGAENTAEADSGDKPAVDEPAGDGPASDENDADESAADRIQDAAKDPTDAVEPAGTAEAEAADVEVPRDAPEPGADDAATESDATESGATAEAGGPSADTDTEKSGTAADAGETGAESNGAADIEPAVDSKPSDSDASPEESAPADSLAPQAPQSRRERRLAEQAQPAGSSPSEGTPPATQEPGSTADSAIESPAAGESGTAAMGRGKRSNPGTAARSSSPAKTAPPAKRSKRRKAWSLTRGTLLFLVIAAAVLAVGTVVTGQDAPTAGPSATELSRQEAWSQSAALLAQAEQLRGQSTDAAGKALLVSTASALDAQLAALSDGLPAGSAAPKAIKSTTAPTMASFATALAGNANTLLTRAVTAEGAMGRVLAAAGTSQLLQSSAINELLGKPTASSPLPAPVLATAAACSSSLSPQPGVSEDAALLAAAQAEQKAVYAYQVAATRLPEQDFKKAMEILADHQARLELINGELALRCLPAAPAVPGYVLDAAFTNAPEKALARLEGELANAYGDLAALSRPAAAVEKAATGPRQLSVSLLLESTLNQQWWGGTVPPLPGISESAAVTPSAPANP